MILLSSQLVRW